MMKVGSLLIDLRVSSLRVSQGSRHFSGRWEPLLTRRLLTRTPSIVSLGVAKHRKGELEGLTRTKTKQHLLPERGATHLRKQVLRKSTLFRCESERCNRHRYHSRDENGERGTCHCLNPLTPHKQFHRRIFRAQPSIPAAARTMIVPVSICPLHCS
jgi:hypothetical protein